MKWIMFKNEREVKLLRPPNTSDGRDAIELEERECDDCNDE